MFKQEYHTKRWTITLLVLLSLAITGCKAQGTSSSSANTQTVTLKRGTLTAVVGATGVVRSNQYTLVNWQTSGKVEKVPVKLGQMVQTDEVLASLDPTSLAQNIIQAKVDLINAQTALDDLLKPQPLKVAQAEADLKDAQTTLDNMIHPSALTIAQAETNLKNMQTALENLMNPDPVAVTRAEQAVLDAQDAVDDAQAQVDRLGYPRGTNAQINNARATYVLAKSEVDRLQNVYEQTDGSPDNDPAKARALSDLDAAKVKRDRALANLNWYEADWSEKDILEKNAALASAQATLADAQETLNKLKNPTNEDVELARARITDAQDALDTLIYPTQTDIELAQQRVADAQETLDRAKNGPTKDDLVVAETRITVAQATINQAQLVAPFAGTVTDIQVMPGDMVSQGQVAFRIDDLSTLYVELQVSEIDVYLIQVGQPVSVTFDAIPHAQYSGKVTDIGLVGIASSGAVIFPVTVQVMNADSAVKTGMTGVANIIIAQVVNVLQVPNRAVQTKDGTKVVYVWHKSEDKYYEIPVQVGLSSDTMTEINSTELNVGDEILITTPSSSLRIGRMFGGGGGGGGGQP
jgi:HlyD family secretion protein